MSHRLGFFFSALLCAACAAPSSAQRFISEPDPISGHRYEVSQTVELWDDAKTKAQAQTYTSQGNLYHGYLTAISSPEENGFINRFFQQFTNTIWIGLTDVNSPRTFYWSNGEPLVYTNWNIGEPNNSSGGEDYVQMLLSGKWNDFPNSGLNYLIEYNTPLPNPPGVPEPGTVALAASFLTLGATFAYRRKRNR